MISLLCSTSPVNITFGFDTRLREWKAIIELIKMMEPSFHVVSVGLLNQILHFLGKSGKTETMMKVC